MMFHANEDEVFFRMIFCLSPLDYVVNNNWYGGSPAYAACPLRFIKDPEEIGSGNWWPRSILHGLNFARI